MRSDHVAIRLPASFGFRHHDAYDFETVLGLFDWELRDTEVIVDLTGCTRANYQALSLLVLYLWHLRSQGCFVQVETLPGRGDLDAGTMWRRMGATGWDHVLWEPAQQFRFQPFKPLIAVREKKDFDLALSSLSSYTQGFNIEYEKTLHYVVSEVMYNTMEHGRRRFLKERHEYALPSLIQFSWYKTRNELSFIVADLGIGVKRHLEHAYPPFESDTEALRKAIQPQVSGTFGGNNGYTSGKNNAGVGLYISTGIVQRLRGDMFLISGQGLLHVSPRDITASALTVGWPGTIAFFTIRLNEAGEAMSLQKVMAELRERSRQEVDQTDAARLQGRLSVTVENYFGRFAENKEEAIQFRDRHLLPAVEQGKEVLLDFQHVEMSTHSFLSALLATPILQLGLAAYKKIRITNASPDIRETIDYILDENTRGL